MPSSYLYLKTKYTETVVGGVYMDHMIEVKYRNTGSIIDTNKKELKASTYGRAYVNPYEYFTD